MRWIKLRVGRVLDCGSHRCRDAHGQRAHDDRGRGAVWSVLAAVIILLAGCSPLRVTPVVSPPSQVWLPGKFVWYDLLTNDVDRARAFYGAVLGWSFEPLGRYTVASSQGQPVAGLVTVKADDQRTPARWLASLSVTDVDDSVARAERAGATIHEGPGELADRGRFALLSDPQGAQLVLLRATTGDPPDSNPVAGSWLWNSLWTENPQQALEFYQMLVGYEVLADGENHWILTKDTHLRAGVRDLPLREHPARWVPTIYVADLDDTLSRIEPAGGQIVIAPGQPPAGDDVALIKDSQGALLILQLWPNDGDPVQ